ncbi:MAG: 2,3-bisphosphoglycerate-independent phosphoglycerate mutase [Defluviitaleaceae bacterium]|nr:2,3-bisphosphoglycerate-independent phosphoglycerate mutase [Defluviitaleaceae bacterium]
MKKPTVLMILDGYGITDNTDHNGVYLANTPNIDKITKKYPNALGDASGLSVGLPRGQMGNSEVGHTNIGAGRIVYQELTRISKAIEDGDFFTHPTLLAAMDNCKQNDKALHLAGLLSDGGVHSHIEHLFALIKMAKDNGLERVYVHAFMDGRDTSPTAGAGYIKDLLAEMDKQGVGKLATITGRYYAMDRDKRWERVKLAYDAMVHGKGEKTTDPVKTMESYYAGEGIEKAVTDEFIPPIVVSEDSTIKEGDSFIFFNFRPDRARQLTTAFCVEDFQGFERPNGYFPLKYFCFTEYDPKTPNKQVVFTSDNLDNTLGEHLANLGFTQMRIAETEKYPHVTFFFNGGREQPFKGEERILVPSPKVATYDFQPEMSAPEVTQKLVESIESGSYDFILINYANPDMVGHTGSLEAVIAAIEAVDEGVGKAYDAVIKTGGQMFICADHGNADKMIDYETKEPHTAHTTNPVPFIVVNSPGVKGVKEGKLCDIAPTILDMMNQIKPAAMTGESLLIK